MTEVVHLFLHDNLKTIADICSLLRIVRVLRRLEKNLGRVRTPRSHVKVKVIFQRIEKVYDFLLRITDSEIPSLVASFSTWPNFSIWTQTFKDQIYCSVSLVSSTTSLLHRRTMTMTFMSFPRRYDIFRSAISTQRSRLLVLSGSRAQAFCSSDDGVATCVKCNLNYCISRCILQVYGSINEEQAVTSPSPASVAATSDAVARQTKPASNRWLRFRLYGSSGSGGRILPSALLGQRRRPASSSALLQRRDYSVDKLTDAVFHEFLRHDPQLDVRPSPLLVAQSRPSLESVVARSVDYVTARRQGRPVPLSAHVEANQPDWLSGGNARRTTPNCRSAASRHTSDLMTTVCRDSS